MINDFLDFMDFTFISFFRSRTSFCTAVQPYIMPYNFNFVRLLCRTRKKLYGRTSVFAPLVMTSIIRLDFLMRFYAFKSKTDSPAISPAQVFHDDVMTKKGGRFSVRSLFHYSLKKNTPILRIKTRDLTSDLSLGAKKS